MSTAEEKSAEARNRGNDFYRKNHFEQATTAYFEASKLNPNDVAPLSNVSAVQSELGNYSASSVYAEKALGLLQNEDDSNPKKQKLYLRQAKARILSRENAEDVVSKLSPSSEKRMLQDCAVSTTHQVSTWPKILRELPRTKPVLQDEPEHYPVGHDVPQAEWDDELASSDHDDVGSSERGRESKGRGSSRRFHFTLLDLKASALARDSIFFHMLDSLETSGEAMACLAYVYGSMVMPSFVYDELQKTLATMIDKIQNRKPLADWIYISKPHLAKICHHLRAWQKECKYDTGTFREWGIEEYIRIIMSRKARGSVPDVCPPNCEIDQKFFQTLGFTLPPGGLVYKYEKGLIDIIDNAGSGEQLCDYLDHNWKPNVTLVDVDWDAKREKFNDNPPSIGCNPLEVAYKLHNCPDQEDAEEMGLKDLLSYFAIYFIMVKHSLKEIRSRLCVEIVVGEMNDCLERIRHGEWVTRGEKQGDWDPSLFPKTFDRIHLSNILDYVGGPLSTFLYAAPLLKQDTSSALKSNVLMNPPAFKSHQDFLAEYTLLPDINSVKKQMREGDWEAYVWRTDTHESATEGVSVWETIQEVDSWEE